MKALFAALISLVVTGAAANAQPAPPPRDQMLRMFDPLHMLAARFDTFAFIPNDPQGRVAYGTERGTVFVLEYKNGYYQQAWASPSMVTRIQQVHVADLSGRGDWTIIAYNTRGSIAVWSADGYRPLWETPETQFNSVEALTTAQVDSDPQLEILFVSEGRLYIYDGAYFVEEWRSDQLYDATRIVVGEVDGDDEPEIILNTGFVLNGFSRSLEWESVDQFGAYMELADIDGDGKLELISGTPNATKIWDIDLRREKWE